MSNVFNLFNVLQESSTQNHYNPSLVNDGMDLSESATSLTIQFNTINREMNERHGVYIEDFATLLTEAARQRPVDIDALEEGFLSDIGSKIVAGYKRLIEMIKSILAKIASFVDSMTKSGAQLVSKYKNKVATDRSKFEYEGFDWVDSVKDKVEYINPCKHFNGASVGKFALNQLYADTPKMYPQDNDTQAQVLIGRGTAEQTESHRDAEKFYRDQLKELEANSDMNTLKVDYAKAIAKGLDLSSYSKLGDALHKLFRGRSDKHTIKNLSVMSFETICAVLEKGKDFSEVSDLYDEMKKQLENSLRGVEAEITKLEKTKDEKDTTAGSKVLKSLQIEFMKKSVSLANDLDSVASQVNNAALTAAKEKYGECRQVFTKLMSYKPAKKQNNSAVDLMDETFMEANGEDFELLSEAVFTLE